MIQLYHGSNIDIKEIDLTKCRPYKDFGQGFYLTVIEEQAEKMAKRVVNIYGGSPIVNIFELDEAQLKNNDLSVKDFGKETSEEWARFVKNNRNKQFSDYSDPECNLDNKYDIVIGPIADDAMALLFRQHEMGAISFQTLLNGLIYKETTNQYSFHTQRAIALLRKVER